MENNSQLNNSLSEKILNRIEKERIQPASKITFQIKNQLFWFLWIISILIGALAVAATFFVIFHSDWQTYNATYQGFFDFIFHSLPYIWILTLLIFLLLAHQNLRHTKYGYRYSKAPIILLSITISLIVGSSLYSFGVGEILDKALGSYIPFYEPAMNNLQGRWNKPEKGLIAGEVTNIAPDFSAFTVHSFDDKTWVIDGKDLLHIDHLILSENDFVKVVGVPVQIDNYSLISSSTPLSFHACLVLPWLKSVHPYENERNVSRERSNVCKGVRPYQILQELQ